MSQTSLSNLSHMTGLSPAELARRAEQLVDAKTGKINALSALDAALVATSAGGAVKAEAFTAAGSASAAAHVIEEPAHVYSHGAPFSGFAPEGAQPPSIGGPIAALEKAAKSGTSKIGGFCGAVTPPPAAPPPAAPPPVALSTDVVSPQGAGRPSSSVARPARPTTPAQQAMARQMSGFAGETPPGTAGGNLDAGKIGTEVKGDLDAASRNMQFEMMKNEIQKMTQLQNAVSNTLAAMHEQAMTAIRNAKA